MSHRRKTERLLIIRHLETMTIRQQEAQNQRHGTRTLTCTITVRVHTEDSGTQKHKENKTHAAPADTLETVKSFPARCPIRAQYTSLLNEQQEMSLVDHMITDW